MTSDGIKHSCRSTHITPTTSYIPKFPLFLWKPPFINSPHFHALFLFLPRWCCAASTSTICSKFLFWHSIRAVTDRSSPVNFACQPLLFYAYTIYSTYIIIIQLGYETNMIINHAPSDDILIQPAIFPFLCFVFGSWTHRLLLPYLHTSMEILCA